MHLGNKALGVISLSSGSSSSCAKWRWACVLAVALVKPGEKGESSSERLDSRLGNPRNAARFAWDRISPLLLPCWPRDARRSAATKWQENPANQQAELYSAARSSATFSALRPMRPWEERACHSVGLFHPLQHAGLSRHSPVCLPLFSDFCTLKPDKVVGSGFDLGEEGGGLIWPSMRLGTFNRRTHPRNRGLYSAEYGIPAQFIENGPPTLSATSILMEH